MKKIVLLLFFLCLLIFLFQLPSIRKDWHNHRKSCCQASSPGKHGLSWIMDYVFVGLCVNAHEHHPTSSGTNVGIRSLIVVKVSMCESTLISVKIFIFLFYPCFATFDWHWNLFRSHFHVSSQVPDFPHIYFRFLAEVKCCLLKCFFFPIMPQLLVNLLWK